MDEGDDFRSQTDSSDGHPSIQCAACASALRSPGRDNVAFLLLDQFTIPLVGCDDHLEEFSSLCGLAARRSVKLLDHRPAGGVHCPGCRHGPHATQQPVVPVGSGALAVLACSTHCSEILDRFRTGLQIRQHLNASLDGSSADP